mmetsp:Transcript_68905/g.217882  ORF Transcript_68905/g.217882 Transcript_68905/m.217882 type:complete len:221 (+) Transcript_68905:897-1559(+)
MWGMSACRSRTFSGPYAGSTFKDRLQLVAILAVCVGGYTVAGMGEVTQALNGAVAALVFNVLYDVLLSKKQRWYAMCPLIDMINHKGTSGSEVSYAYFQDEFDITVDVATTAGEEVFITYGNRGNDELLQYYGFVEERAPADTYAVLDIVKKLRAYGADVSDGNVEVLRKAGFMKDLEQARATPAGFTRESLRALRFISASIFTRGTVEIFLSRMVLLFS